MCGGSQTLPWAGVTLPRGLQIPLRRKLWSFLARKHCELSPAGSRGGGSSRPKQPACPELTACSLQPRLGLWFGSCVRHQLVLSKTRTFLRAGTVICVALCL